MKRKASTTFTILVAGLMAQSLSAQTTVTVQNSQAMGVRLLYDGTTTTTDQTYDKSFVRGKTVTDSGTGAITDEEWGKAWLQFDLSSVWATYGQANLASATLTIWGENGTGRRFSVAGLLDSLGLENWDMNTLSWDNAPGNDPTSGTAIDFSKVYGGAPLWTVQNSSVDAVVTDFGSSITGITDGNYDQCARYISLDTDTSIADFLKTDTDGKVTLIGYDHTNSSNQRWWTGIAGTYVYADDASNGLLAPDGEMIRNSPTLTLTFVPEPGSLSLVALGLGGLFLVRRLS